jgi:DNA-damage-inducible protein D
MTDLTLFGRSPFDSICREDEDGEYWSARELMPLLGYDRWENFAEAVERGRVVIENSGQDADWNASWRREPSGKTTRVNYRLTRYACYLVAGVGVSRP